jgi:hypothetical protein
MDSSSRTSVGRRDLLRALAIGTVSAAATGVAPTPAHADTETPDEKRKTRYQANSAQVQTFYRVNRYPAA